MKDSIIKRDITDEIKKYIDTDNVLVLHGARQVGKSHIMFYLENELKENNKRTFFIDLEDSRFVDILNKGVEETLSYIKSAGINIAELISQKSRLYLFIDEIQYLDNPSSLLKLFADHHKYIQLIVSGSSTFDIKTKFSNSLVGRTVEFEVFNLSFAEFLRFKNISIDLSALSDTINLSVVKELYREFVLYGGYPKIVAEDSLEIKEKYIQQIIDTYINKDIRDLAKITDIKKFNNMLKILASQSAQMLSISELASACSIARQTVEKYLFILENTYVIKLLQPYSINKKVEVVKAPKVFFYDTGLQQMLWLKSLQKSFTGGVFETSIFTELVKKYGRANINYWRNKNQNEIDFILSIKEKLLPIEVKNSFSSFKNGSIRYFEKKYNINDYKVVALNGEKLSPNYYYPWEL